MRKLLPWVAIIASVLLILAKPIAGQTIVGSDLQSNGHYLVYRATGAPFLWLGDTAWGLPQMLTRANIDTYLNDRQTKGFTVVQASIFISPNNQYNYPSADGYCPFTTTTCPSASAPICSNITWSVGTRDDRYFNSNSILRYFVDGANSRNMHVALLPLFAGECSGNLLANVAQDYGQYLGSWFGSSAHPAPNVIWVLGGDVDGNCSPPNCSPPADWPSLARGIAIGVNGVENYSNLVMTYHPTCCGVPDAPHSSSAWFQNSAWLALNMIQSGFPHPEGVQPAVHADYQLLLPSIKPTGVGEGWYERGVGDGPYNRGQIADAFTVRREAYWSFLGGLGYYTYGDACVYGFGAVGWSCSTVPWSTALADPGSNAMTFYKNFLMAQQWQALVPDQTLFASGVGENITLNVAAISADGNRIVAYLSSSTATVSLNTGRIAKPFVLITFYSPSSGVTTVLGCSTNTAQMTFSTPAGQQDAAISIVGSLSSTCIN